MTVGADVIVIGVVTGLPYAILAAGLVLIYRATKVINFAHGEIGAFGAAILAKLVIDYDWPFLLALVAVLAGGAALGGLIELTVVRRLFHAPRLILLVATIGLSQLLLFGQLALPGVSRSQPFPSAIDWTLDVGSVRLLGAHLTAIVVIPAVVLALGWFLTQTSYGVAIRAAASNPDAAELAGISTKRVSTIVWVIAGALATLTVVLISPIRGAILGLPSEALGPGLLLRALAAGMVGRMRSLPLALIGGIAVGVVEILIQANFATATADVVLFVAVLGLVLLRGGGIADQAERWSITPKLTPVPIAVRDVGWVRNLRWIVAGAAGLIALAVPLLIETSVQLQRLQTMAVYAIVGISLTVLVGWAGQLSLGQFAFVGFGAFATAALQARGMSFGFAVAYATAAGVAVAVAVGFPALRVRGLFLAITTLAFAVVAHSWLFAHDQWVGEFTTPSVTRGRLLGVDLSSQRAYFYLCLVALAGAALVVSRLRRTGIGRSVVAVRDNEAAAASFGLSVAHSKLLAFAVSGGLAAAAGGLYAGVLGSFNAELFAPAESLRLVAIAVIGGLGSVGGAVLGAVYVIGLPALLGDSREMALLTSGIGVLLILLYLPGGLISAAYAARDALLSWYAGQRDASGIEPPPPPPVRTTLEPAPRIDQAPGSPVLATHGVRVTFGGRVAVADVSIEVQPGETVGLIGSNGAGKSTLMNAITGFVTPAGGSIEIFGMDVTGLSAHQRARLGVGRVFQDARLFGDLTVHECISVALEQQHRSELVPSLLGLAPSRVVEARRWREAAEYVGFMGLGRYADTQVSGLSTGTRRIVELACLVAQRPALLLLDEPTAGVAQKEAEQFGPLVNGIKTELGASLLLIEHDMPLVMSMSDRIYCLSAGSLIAAGRPDAVRNDPKVVAAYLGTDERAIARSGAR